MVKSVHQPLRHYSLNVWTPCSLVCEMIGLDFDLVLKIKKCEQSPKT